jgi:hypothetical protein
MTEIKITINGITHVWKESKKREDCKLCSLEYECSLSHDCIANLLDDKSVFGRFEIENQ